ncbi:MAG: pentapeptide repeat-containing protein [Candidatus Thiodiazotropha sp.]
MRTFNSGARLEGVTLKGVSFARSDLRGASMQGLDLSRGRFRT